MEYEAAVDCSSVPARRRAGGNSTQRFDMFFFFLTSWEMFPCWATRLEVGRRVESLHRNRLGRLNQPWKMRLITLTIPHFSFLQKSLYIPFNVKEVTGVARPLWEPFATETSSLCWHSSLVMVISPTNAAMSITWRLTKITMHLREMRRRRWMQKIK